MAEKITGWNTSEETMVREQLSRLLESSLFTHNERLGRYLKFVVDEMLKERANRINQYVIAIDVFDRDESFDPMIDAAVALNFALVWMLR